MKPRFTTAHLFALGVLARLWLGGDARCRAQAAGDAGAAHSASPDGGAGADGPDAGQGADADGGPQVAGVVAPRLLEAADAELPAEAAGISGAVVLRLTVGVDGRVTAADVIEPLGHGMDEPVRQAALRFRFEPARRDGHAISARIRYAYEIAPVPATATAPASTPAPVSAPAPTPAPAAPPPPPPPPPVVDVTVRGASAVQRLRESAEAVTVVEIKQAQRETADLGEVLARTQGVSVRRGGGLGSYARISLNGLIDDQIRFFLDGVPLDVAGFGLGLQNVPVGLVERVEIYRGVVPLRFGADALGGAVNLVSPDEARGSRAAASAELGSYGRYRFTATGRRFHAPLGAYLAANAFLDHADNDYPVDVEVPDERGRLSAARVYRFHDAYDAYGGGVEAGLVDRPWARRLVLRAFATRQDKELQHNLVMTVPYGEARYWEAVRGSTLRYELPRIGRSSFGVHALLAYSRRETAFIDLSPFVYDWFGRQIRARVRPGEIGNPTDERIWQDTVLARLGGTWTPLPALSVRLAAAPTFADRSGRNHVITIGRDPLTAERRYLSVVSGAEGQLDLLGGRLETITFGKGYLFEARSEEPLPGGVFRRRDQDSLTLGAGQSARLRLGSVALLKASYERATRLPSPDEIFGNGVLIVANLDLGPERSHNANLGGTLDLRRTRAGDFRGEVNLFLRHAQNLIVLLGNDMVFTYQNVFTARSQGVEGAAGWTSPGGYLALDGNVTWQSLRNRSTSGTFADFDGDRIPNRPWLFGNLSARALKTGVSSARDELSLGYYARHVRGFFRGWESLGLREFKQVVPAQTTHALALTYVTRGALTQTWTAEVDNLSDARAYDFFGVQRPGRAFAVKVTAEY